MRPTLTAASLDFHPSNTSTKPLYVQEADQGGARSLPKDEGAELPRSSSAILLLMASETRMVFLGFGKFARADKIYALEPLRGAERGDGKRTKVWVEGLTEPVIASRTER